MIRSFRIAILFCLLPFFKASAITYLFSHGIADSYKQAYRYVKTYTWCGMQYENDHYIIDGKLKTFNYQDVIVGPIFNPCKSSLGQKNEIEALKKAYDQIDDDEIVLVGVSRGAAVALTFLAKHEPKKIKAVVLEAPFDDAKTVFNYCWYVKLIAKLTCAGSENLYKWFSAVSAHDQEGEKPIDLLERIKKDVPIMIWCTENDNTVSCKASVAIYKKLKKIGHKGTYLLKVKKGKHSKLLRSEEGETCQNVTHAFYKKHGLPYKDEFAKKGKQEFKNCQPSLKDLQEEKDK